MGIMLEKLLPSVYKELHASKCENFFIFRVILNQRTPRYDFFVCLENEEILLCLRVPESEGIKFVPGKARF